MDKLSKLNTFDYAKVLVAFCYSFAHKAWVTGLCLYEQVSFGKEFNFLFSLLQELVLIYMVWGRAGRVFLHMLTFLPSKM